MTKAASENRSERESRNKRWSALLCVTQLDRSCSICANRRLSVESDAQSALQNAIASKNSFAARTSQHVAAFHHFVTDSPKFGCTLNSTERVELCREHVSWLQTNCEILRKSTREQDGYLHGHAKQKCRRRKHKNGLGYLVAYSAESLLTDTCMF
jgi:hypothetical protein